MMFKIALRTYLISFLLGASSILAFAPFNFYPLIFLSIVSLLYITNKNESANIKSFMFGSGFFVFGIYWIYICLQKFGGMPYLMALFSTLALCLFLALFFLPFSLFSKYKNNVFFIPAFFTLIELLRSFIFTGFPWLSLGYTQVPNSPLIGYLPIFGIHGVSFLVVLSSVLIFQLFRQKSKKLYLIIFLILIWSCGQYFRGIEWSKPIGETVSTSLIQGNISQDKKWNKNMVNESLDHYQKLILNSDASLIILPETSIPIEVNKIPINFMKKIKNHIAHNNGYIIFGAIESTMGRYYNSALLIGKDSEAVYRKNHLVPFGEFIPFEKYLRYIYQNWLNIPFTNLSRGKEKSVDLFKIKDLNYAINICYEDVFGNEIAWHNKYISEPNVLVNISNDAWYGKSIAAEQHLQISQARAIENKRMMVRSTNTGVTAFISRDGKVLKKLPQFTSGGLRHDVQGYSGATPYMILNNFTIYFLCISILFLYLRRSIFLNFKKLFFK
jgi:apolipoprotein N-acyltransferase